MANEKMNLEREITNDRFYSDGNDFVILKKVVDGKVVFDNTKKKNNKKESSKKQNKQNNTIKKLEKKGVKLTNSEKALIKKADNFLEKAKEGKISESESQKKVLEIFGKLTTIKD
jgi:hypothetical protein